MNNQNQKGIASSLAIIIVIVVGVFAIGGVLAYQYWWQVPKEEIPEETPKDETAEWQTYKNEGYGFEIKYPDDWRLITGCPNYPKCVKFIPQILPKEGYYDSLLIEVIDRDSTTYEDWISGKPEGRSDFPYTVNKIKDIVVGGKETEIFEDPVTIGVGHYRVLFLIKDNLVYKITGSLMTDSFSQEKFDKILSTFRFID